MGVYAIIDLINLTVFNAPQASERVNRLNRIAFERERNMTFATKLYHGVPAILIDGHWVVLSAKFEEIAAIPENNIDDVGIFNELKSSGFFEYADVKPLTYQLTLITTSDCNLRCKYCFASSGETAKSMSEEVALSSVDYALKAASGRRLSVAFFGGEPTLTSSLIKRVVDYAREQERKTPDVNGVEFSITTNGVVNTNFLDFMVDNDFQITISCDGPPDIQDEQRPTQNEGLSSSALKKTLLHLRKRGKEYKVRVTVTELSVMSMTQTVEWIHGLGGKSIHFEPVTISGRATKGSLLGKPAPDVFIENLKRAILRGNELGVGIVNSSFMNISSPPPSFCEGNSRNRISVSYTGDVTTCVEVQERCHPASNDFIIGRYDCDEGTLHLDRDERPGICGGSHMSECKSCFAVRICGGGCPVRNFHITGTTSNVDPYRCVMIKEMLPFITSMIFSASASASTN